ncbi:MAG: hypothetical protein AAFU73_17630 [Planctomycetota bacterium]
MIRVLLAVAASATLAACSAPSASVMPLIGSLGISGDLSIQDQSSLVGGASANSTFDELGLDDEAAIGALVRVGFAGAELSVAGIGVDFSGRGTTNSEFDFEGITINADTDVETDIGLQMARALFTWDVLPLPGVDLGLGLGATLIDLDFRLRDVTTGETIETDQLIPVPLLGARAAWTWGPVKLRADAGGLIAEYDGNEATVLDGEISAAVDVLQTGQLTAGYRVTRIDAVYDDSDARIDADLGLEGYYIGLRFGF